MTTHEFLSDSWDMLVGRSAGPLNMRLIFQPTVAAFFGGRSGLKDAREKQTPYLMCLLTNPETRSKRLQHGWSDVGKVFLMAFALDVGYELYVFNWVYPVQALIVAVVLAMVPYIIVRSLSNRVFRQF